MLFSAAGKVVRFKEDAVRAMGRTATGVRGIKLAGEDKVVSLIVPRGEGAILTVTQNVPRRKSIPPSRVRPRALSLSKSPNATVPLWARCR